MPGGQAPAHREAIGDEPGCGAAHRELGVRERCASNGRPPPPRFDSTVQTLQAHLPEIGPLHALYLSQRFEPAPQDWLDRRAESGGGSPRR